MIGRSERFVRAAVSVGRLGRPRPAGVRSGWLGPNGRVVEAPGTAVHEALLEKFGSPNREDFFVQGAVRFVEADDYVSLEFIGNNRVAVEHAIAALSGRWANRPEVEIEFVRQPGLVSGSAAAILQDLHRRLLEIHSGASPVD